MRGKQRKRGRKKDSIQEAFGSILKDEQIRLDAVSSLDNEFPPLGSGMTTSISSTVDCEDRYAELPLKYNAGSTSVPRSRAKADRYPQTSESMRKKQQHSRSIEVEEGEYGRSAFRKNEPSDFTANVFINVTFKQKTPTTIIQEAPDIPRDDESNSDEWKAKPLSQEELIEGDGYAKKSSEVTEESIGTRQASMRVDAHKITQVGDTSTVMSSETSIFSLKPVKPTTIPSKAWLDSPSQIFVPACIRRKQLEDSENELKLSKDSMAYQEETPAIAQKSEEYYLNPHDEDLDTAENMRLIDGVSATHSNREICEVVEVPRSDPIAIPEAVQSYKESLGFGEYVEISMEQHSDELQPLCREQLSKEHPLKLEHAFSVECVQYIPMISKVPCYNSKLSSRGKPYFSIDFESIQCTKLLVVLQCDESLFGYWSNIQRELSAFLDKTPHIELGLLCCRANELERIEFTKDIRSVLNNDLVCQGSPAFLEDILDGINRSHWGENCSPVAIIFAAAEFGQRLDKAVKRRFTRAQKKGIRLFMVTVTPRMAETIQRFDCLNVKFKPGNDTTLSRAKSVRFVNEKSDESSISIESIEPHQIPKDHEKRVQYSLFHRLFRMCFKPARFFAIPFRIFFKAVKLLILCLSRRQ